MAGTDGEIDDVFSLLREHMLKRSAERQKKVEREFEATNARIKDLAVHHVQKYQKSIESKIDDYKRTIAELSEERSGILKQIKVENAKISTIYATFTSEVENLNKASAAAEEELRRKLSKAFEEARRKFGTTMSGEQPTPLATRSSAPLGIVGASSSSSTKKAPPATARGSSSKRWTTTAFLSLGEPSDSTDKGKRRKTDAAKTIEDLFG
ncbi:hypothetical protein DFJ73DRAFT_841710 [Zopfochytrium polystomum]|nr:hypothetical protein DFJ73DRAFT_841710 [Zopfochytrium polystomum]